MSPLENRGYQASREHEDRLILIVEAFPEKVVLQKASLGLTTDDLPESSVFRKFLTGHEASDLADDLVGLLFAEAFRV
jgi:hypothetical protein